MRLGHTNLETTPLSSASNLPPTPSLSPMLSLQSFSEAKNTAVSSVIVSSPVSSPTSPRCVLPPPLPPPCPPPGNLDCRAQAQGAEDAHGAGAFAWILLSMMYLQVPHLNSMVKWCNNKWVISYFSLTTIGVPQIIVGM